MFYFQQELRTSEDWQNLPWANITIKCIFNQINTDSFENWSNKKHIDKLEKAIYKERGPYSSYLLMNDGQMV